MTNYNIKGRLVAISIIAMLLTGFMASCAEAQSNLRLTKTDNPSEYVEAVLDDIELEGMSAVRQVFEEMGLNNPQSDAAISTYELSQSEADKRWTNLIGVVETGEVLKQYYGYAYLGGNGWIFIRIDFLRAGETDWVLSAFTFNSEYQALIMPEFNVAD